MHRQMPRVDCAKEKGVFRATALLLPQVQQHMLDSFIQADADSKTERRT